MAIRLDEAWKQLWDWGGDYDVFDNRSFDGGVRDAATPNKNGSYEDSFNTQGTNKPGYDSTGRAPAVTDKKPTTQDTGNGNGNGNGGGNGNGNGGGAAPKVLDEAKLRSLDAYLSDVDTVRDQAIERARLRREAAKREKEDEFNRETGKYEGEKLGVLQDFAGAKTDTDLNTRNTIENLMSSLSTLGLGGSRALMRQILDAANMSNRKANATQGENTRGLDSAYNEFKGGNENDKLKIEDQYGFDTGEAQKAWGKERQNTLHKKADVYNSANRAGERASIMQEADGLGSVISNAAFMNPQYTGASRAMATPELADYTQDIARYDTSSVGAGATGMTPVGTGVTPGNLAVKAMAVNDKDLGVKKKLEGVDPVLGV